MPERNSKEKLELAERIASQTKRVTKKYEDVEGALFRVIRWFSSIIDRFLFNPKWAALVSFVLAIMIYAVFTVNTDNSLFNVGYTPSTTLNGRNIVFDYNEDKWEITSSDTNVNVVLSGDASSLSMQTSSSNYSIVADLNGLSSGTHTVRLIAKDFMSGVNVSIQPSTITVTIKEKVTKNFSITHEYINRSQMDSIYALGTPEFAVSQVAVRASQDTLDTIAFVKAFINVESVSNNFEQEARLVAYDQEGNPVKCDIIPSTVLVSVQVTSPKKEVPIVVEPQGEIPNDMAIDSITLDHDNVTVYAPETVLSKITEITVSFDAAQLTSDTNLRKGISPLPTGVNQLSVSNITMQIKLGEKVSKTFDNIPIKYENFSSEDSAKYNVTSDDSLTTSVTVYGTQKNVDAINAEDIMAWVDFASVSAGTHDIAINIDQVPSKLVTMVSTKATVKITFTNKDGSTPGHEEDVIDD